MALTLPFRTRGSFTLPKTEKNTATRPSRPIPTKGSGCSLDLRPQPLSEVVEEEAVPAPAPAPTPEKEEGRGEKDNARRPAEFGGPAPDPAPPDSNWKLPRHSKDEQPFEKCLYSLPEVHKDWSFLETNPLLIAKESIEFADVTLEDFEHITTLGVGGFGRVELVKFQKAGEDRVMALKCLKKINVIHRQQEQNVYNEKNLMLECRECQFVVKLFKTYKDSKYVYFLMEPCLGGDVFTILQKHHFLNDATARFITACVVEALDFLHERNIVYKSLSPENVMLDSRGYVKMIDFGFAEKVSSTSKRGTFALTSDYIAPEIILGNDYDKAIDYWALGNFIFELLVGRPPFTASNHLKLYNIILKGIGEVHFPKNISKSANHLIKRLCHAVATERLGYQKDGVADIRDHKWFHGFNWLTLQEGTMKSLIEPQLSGPTDTRYFDRYTKSMDIPADELSGWDKDF